MITKSLFFPIFFLLTACVLVAVRTAFQTISETEIEERMRYSKWHLFFFHWLGKLFPNEKDSIVLDFLTFTGVITLACYGMSSSIYLASNLFFSSNIIITGNVIGFTFPWLLLAFAICTSFAICINTLFHLFALKAPIATLKLFSLITTLIVIIFFIISLPFIWVEKLLAGRQNPSDKTDSPEELRSRLLELLEEMQEEKLIEEKDGAMIKSIAQFGKLVVREIMVPRVDMICLPETATAQEAFNCFIEHEYSRVPIYRESIDHITGLLLYKKFTEYCLEQMIEGRNLSELSISSLAIPILYAPENKRIRDLLNEIKSEKIHAAIVVNEYGCTEGLVTIEDILEELVGSEIRDEHDVDEEVLFKRMHDKSWVVDGRMSIVDVERELSVVIPHNAEYETIAGFISWKMGAIPPSGTMIHEDLFNLRILESDRRQIHKVKISVENPQI